MSTTTKNFGLIKPEKTDPADITATNPNWDVIDREIKKRDIKSYTSLAQLGLSDSDLSTSDFKSNIETIITALGVNSSAVLILTANENLAVSTISQINSDVSLSIDANTTEGWIYVAPTSHDYRPYRVSVMLDREIGAKAFFCTIVNRNLSGTLVHPFVVEHDPKGFVSKGGDTMYGDLIINSYGTDFQTSLRDYNNSTELRSEKTDGSGDYDSLIMYNEKQITELSQKLKFRVCKNGASKDYAIYGEHNKPTPSAIGVAPAVADSTYTNCYYRMVNGKKEWINPPMEAGIEYPLTERYDGYPLYAKLISVSALPATSSMDVSVGVIGNYIRSIDTCIHTSWNSATQHPFISLTGTYTPLTKIYVNEKANLHIETNFDASNYSLDAIIKYIKP